MLYNNYYMNIQEMEPAILSVINAIPEEARKIDGANDARWTRVVKEQFIQLGKQYGYFTCTSGFEECDGEWLFDLCWYANNDPKYEPDVEKRHMSQFVLALESEWNPSFTHIKGDFEKLLVVKAPFKVMIFQASNRTVDELFDKLEECIKFFSSKPVGERYILACYENNTGRFKTKVIVNGAVT